MSDIVERLLTCFDGEEPTPREREAAFEIARLRGDVSSWVKECERLRALLHRCETILGNMAKENEGAVFNRWPINHEPLRADARNILPDIHRILEDGK
jgi:hypothetical protein